MDAKEEIGNAAESKANAAAGRGRPMKILVVDDEHEIVSVLTQYLEEIGFNVCGAETTKEALDRLKAWTPDVLLTDVQMNGGGAASILQQLEKRSSAPHVLLMTGGALEWAQKAVREGKACGVIEKPFTLDTLIHMIDSLDCRDSAA